MASFLAWMIYPGGDPLYRLGLGGPQNWSGRFGEERNLYASARNRTPDRPFRSLVAVVSTVWNYTSCTLILWLTVIKLASMPLWPGQLKRS